MITARSGHGDNQDLANGTRQAIRGRVELAMSCEPDLRILARLTVSTLAARLGFDIDAIEDLRLAIDELCTSCATGAGSSSRIRLCFEHDESSLRVECTVDGIGDTLDAVDDVSFGSMSPDELSQRILEELVDDYAIGDVTEGERHGHLEKRRQPAER